MIIRILKWIYKRDEETISTYVYILGIFPKGYKNQLYSQLLTFWNPGEDLKPVNSDYEFSLPIIYEHSLGIYNADE